MDDTGDPLSNNNDDCDVQEESTSEIEEDPDTNNQPSPSVDPPPASEESTHNDGQRDVPAEWSDDRGGAAASQIPTYCWYWFWSMLVLLGFIIAVYCPWLVSILISMSTIIGILGYPILISNNHQGTRCRTLQSYRSDNSATHRYDIPQLFDMVINLFIFLAFITVMFNTPLYNENAQLRDIATHDNVNDTHRNFLINNEDYNINENATLYNNFDENIVTTHINDEQNIQSIVSENIASEALDDRTYDMDMDLALIEVQALLNLDYFDADEIEEVSSESDSYTNDEGDLVDDDDGSYLEFNSDSISNNGENFTSEISNDVNDEEDDGERSLSSRVSYDTESENDSINDNSESGYSTNEDNSINNDNDAEGSDISNITNEMDNENDDKDDMSVITHITDDADNGDDSIDDDHELTVDTDSGCDTNGENDSVNNDMESTSSMFAESGYDANGEDNSINDDNYSEQSLISNISDEANNENDQIDEDDKMSIITHITDDMESEDGSIELTVSTDSGCDTNEDADSFIDNDETDLLDEIQNDRQLDQTISSVEQPVSSTLLIDSSPYRPLKVEENDVEDQERVLSIDTIAMQNLNQPSSILLNDDSNEEIVSLQAASNQRGAMDPLVLTEFQDNIEEREQSHASENIRPGDDQSEHVVLNNGQNSQVLSAADHFIDDVQNDEQLGVTNEGRASRNSRSGSSSYQTIQNEQKVEDQNEDDCQAISLSTHPMAAYFQKQPSPADSDEELSQENNT